MRGVCGRREFLIGSQGSPNKSASFDFCYMPEFTSDCSYFGAVEQFFEKRTDKLITFSISTSLWALSLFFPLILFSE